MKVKVTKMNFTKKLQEAIKKDPFLDMLTQATGSDLTQLPDEQEIWLNTDYIVAIDDVLPEELSSGAFTIHLGFGNDKMQTMYIKKDCYDLLLKAWQGECGFLYDGEYKIGHDGTAEISEDGKTVTVRYIKYL